MLVSARTHSGLCNWKKPKSTCICKIWESINATEAKDVTHFNIVEYVDRLVFEMIYHNCVPGVPQKIDLSIPFPVSCAYDRRLVRLLIWYYSSTAINISCTRIIMPHTWHVINPQQQSDEKLQHEYVSRQHRQCCDNLRADC